MGGGAGLQESPPRPWMDGAIAVQGKQWDFFSGFRQNVSQGEGAEKAAQEAAASAMCASPRQRGRGSIALCSELVCREVQLPEGWASLLRMGRCRREGATQNLTRAPQPARGSEEAWEGAQPRPQQESWQ